MVVPEISPSLNCVAPIQDPDKKAYVAECAPTLDTRYGQKWGLENQHINQGCPMFVTHENKSDDDKSQPIGFNSREDPSVTGEHAGPLTASSPQSQAVAHPLLGKHNSSHAADQDTYVAHSLKGEGFDASEDGTGRGTPIVPQVWAVRRLTPVECERLQAFPDNYTLIPTTTNRTITADEAECLRRYGAEVWQEPAKREVDGVIEEYTRWRTNAAPDGPRYKAMGNSMAVNVMRWIGARIDMVDRI